MTISDTEGTSRPSKSDIREAKKLLKTVKKVTGPLTKLVPKTDSQREYLAALEKFQQVVAVGPAGTGKTFLPITSAAHKIMDGQLSRLVLCRPTVGNDEEIGFLPGGLNAKMHNWLLPIYDALYTQMKKEDVQKWATDGTIEIAPFQFISGRTFTDAFVFLDEAQNTTKSQMRRFLTRIGDGTQVVINGDIQQTDRKDNNSGLRMLVDMLERYPDRLNRYVKLVKFGAGDVVRSPATKAWVRAFDDHDDYNARHGA